MTRAEIKQRMLKSIQANLNSKIEEVVNTISENDVDEFMWSKDYGENMIKDFIDEEDLKFTILEKIYDKIDKFGDLVSPF